MALWQGLIDRAARDPSRVPNTQCLVNRGDVVLHEMPSLQALQASRFNEKQY